MGSKEIGSFLLMLIVSSFCLESFSLPLQHESLSSVLMQRKASQENAIKHSGKFQHVFIHKSSSGGGSSGGSSRSGSSGSSRPASSGGKTRSSGGSKQTNSGGTTKSSGVSRTSPTRGGTGTSSVPVYVSGNTNYHNSHRNGASNCNRIGLSTLVAATVASILHVCVAFGRR